MGAAHMSKTAPQPKKQTPVLSCALQAAMLLCCLVSSALLFAALLENGVWSTYLFDAGGTGETAAPGAVEGRETLRVLFANGILLFFMIESWRGYLAKAGGETLPAFLTRMFRMVLTDAVILVVFGVAAQLMRPARSPLHVFLEPIPVLLICCALNVLIAAVFGKTGKRMQRKDSDETCR